jgi:hypothetical protein
MADPGLWDKIFKALEQYPGILALLVVIYWLYRIIQGKDITITNLLEISQGDIERTSKLTALLEILVNRKEA